MDGILRAGENILTVSFRSPVREVAGLPARPAAFTAERLYTRRIQCSYGWDWVGRFVTMGIQNSKPGYYAFKRAAAPVICSVTNEDERYAAYVSNAGAALAAGTVRLYRYNILTGSEDTLGETAFTSPAGSAQIVLSVPEGCVMLDDTHILLCDLASEAGIDRAFFLPLRWPDAEPTVTYTPDAVTVTAPETIPALLLDAACVLEGNGMFLKRGETVLIPVTDKLL